MSDVKEVGVIGQKYEDRTTGKVGTLDSRDDKCKTLMLIDSDGKGFSISYSSFRSRWRKVKDSNAEEVVKDAPKVVEKIESDKSVEDVIKSFNTSNKGAQIVSGDDGYYFIKDDFKVMYVKFCEDGTYSAMCFPDIYTDSTELRTYTSDFKCNMVKSGLDIRFNVSKMSFATLVNLVQSAVVNINLYGYIKE